MMSMVRVAVTKGNERYDNVYRALSLIEDDIEILERKVLIKPNFVSTSIPLCATHREAVGAVLDFLENLGVKKFIIAEGSAIGDTMEGFKNYGYFELAEDYNIKFVDLNKDDWIKVKLFNSALQRKVEVRVSKTVLESYRVSVTRPKTHDTVVVTLTIKNLAVGSLVGSDKSLIHQGYAAINLNLALLAKLVSPNIAIIDGFVGMEGNGPLHGTPVTSRWTVASTNGLAVDMVATELMGFNFKDVGYLFYCSKLGLGPRSLEEIEIVGNSIDECRMRFRPHETYKEQLKWKVDNWKDLLKLINY